jgi:transposase
MEDRNVTGHSMTRPAHDGIVIGVDTHRDTHTAVALGPLGGWLGCTVIPTTPAGYHELVRWAVALGPVRALGVEGTGSHGKALTRHLLAAGHAVLEVDRPDRSARRRRGKSDPIDAELAARQVLAGTATTLPKRADGTAEALRLLVLTKRSADKSRTATINQLRSMILTAPAELREQLRGLRLPALLRRCAAFRPGDPVDPAQTPRHTLRLLARRILVLQEEIADTTRVIDRITAATAPELRARTGVGPDVAAALLVAMGDNPDRIEDEAAFAALCGVNPVPASSGTRDRHRLNRGGDRQANRALHIVVLSRMRWHAPTRAYVERRTTEGKGKKEIMRCLKRYVARELHPLLLAARDG